MKKVKPYFFQKNKIGKSQMTITFSYSRITRLANRNHLNITH